MPEGILHGGMEGWQRRAAHLWPWLCMESGAGNLLSCPVMTQPCALVPCVLQEVPQPGRVHHSVPQDIPLPCPAGRTKLYFMERYYSLKSRVSEEKGVWISILFSCFITPEIQRLIARPWSRADLPGSTISCQTPTSHWREGKDEGTPWNSGMQTAPSCCHQIKDVVWLLHVKGGN